jgi:iron complex outermembrane receptor protein
MKKLIIFLFLSGLLQLLQAQHSVSGKIIDLASGEPLIGVNIYAPELSIGAVSDKDGQYKLSELPKGDLIIQFSYVGFEAINRRIFIRDSLHILNIEMDPDVIQGQEVVISGNFTSTQHENTLKISTVGIDYINTSGHPSLIESITEIPGVNMISKGPGVITPVIRGLSLSNILVLRHGMPIENFQFSEDHPYLIDENGLKQVEVIKGPASLIYGSGAVGGVINLVPEPVASQGMITGEFTTRYFGNTKGLLSNLGIKGNQKGIVWGISGGINSNKDYVQGNNEKVPNTRFNRYNIKSDMGLIRKKGTFRLFYEQSKNNFGMAVLPAFEIVKDDNRKNEAWFQNLTDHMLISQNRLFIGHVKLDLFLSYQNNNRKLNGNPDSEEFNRVNMTLQTFSYRIKANHSFTENLKATFGVQGMYQNNKNHEAPDHVLPDATINEISVYGIAQYTIGRFKPELGLRYSFNTIYVPYQEAGGHSHEEDEHEEEEVFIEYDGQFGNLSASLGSSFVVNEENILRLNLASAYRSPNLPELTQYGMHGIRFEQGNPDLKTQQNLEIDLGYHLHTKHTSLDLSAFYNFIYDYIFLSPTNDTTDEGQKIYRYSQTDARLYGGEAMLHIHPHPLDWLHFKSTYSYVIGEQVDGGYLPRIPAQQLYLELKVEQDAWKVFRNIYLSGGVNFVFDQNHPSAFETSTSGYNLFNMGFGFDLKVNRQLLNFNLTANNLLNIDYYDHLSTLKDLGLYDMGRNISVSVKIPFTITN